MSHSGDKKVLHIKYIFIVNEMWLLFRAECGYATVHDVTDMSLEDRQVKIIQVSLLRFPDLLSADPGQLFFA